MIIDTTYLLPLVGISVDSDLFSAMDKKAVKFNLDNTIISQISLFEIQAISAKLGISRSIVSDALNEIRSNFDIVPFEDRQIIQISFKLRKMLPNYIDCVILASAISRKTDILTEDSRIISLKDHINSQYGISVNKLNQIIS
ncbi:MAG: PIN domain-containing protein [Candidatus Thermoplasmatota archaeon]|nr:PIN domain-containing protein [Candidatus Thermoplasmatota archaeon]MCL5988300.1 PIN domain-containing protein [Candidatus Thermoplasmatota archaeon]